MNQRLPANLEKNALRVSLQSEGSEGCWFTVIRSYKLRSQGDQVIVGDQIILLNTITHLPLHSSSFQLEDHPDSFEVNVAHPQKKDSQSTWKAKLFLEHHKDPEKVLKGGDVIRFYHAEQEKVHLHYFLSAETLPGCSHPILDFWTVLDIGPLSRRSKGLPA